MGNRSGSRVRECGTAATEWDGKQPSPPGQTVLDMYRRRAKKSRNQAIASRLTGLGLSQVLDALRPDSFRFGTQHLPEPVAVQNSLVGHHSGTTDPMVHAAEAHATGRSIARIQ